MECSLRRAFATDLIEHGCVLCHYYHELAISHDKRKKIQNMMHTFANSINDFDNV